MIAWLVATVAGGIAGQAIPDLERFGIGFAFTAAFIAMARALWPGKAAVAPWGTAFAVTVGLVWLGVPTAAALIVGALSGVAMDFVVNPDDA